MKKFILAFGLLLANVSFAQISTPAPSPAATVKQSFGLAEATIEYSRPSLKGRKMMGSTLVPYGKVWRTGANKIPNLILSKDVEIEGNKVPAGTYGIITIPNAASWTIILSGNSNQWGTYGYKDTEDKFKFNVKAEKTIAKEENFTMGFSDLTLESANVFISWENTKVKFKLSHNPNEQIMAEIKEKTVLTDAKGDTFFGAAEYYYDKGLDLNQAFEWANKVVAEEKAYWTYNLRGKIAAKLGKCDVAIADANAGMAMAKKANDPAYIIKLQTILNSCKGK
jgi:Protein of unknown function (DUF2911)